MEIDRIAEINMLPEALAKPIPTHFRVGLIAAGRIVHNEVMSAYRTAGITPVAAADPDPAARNSLQAHWGVEQVFADYREMLDTVEMDVVDINLRWDVGLSPTRVDAVARAAQRGIHVIVAKPMAETWEQCQAMVAHARRGGVRAGGRPELALWPGILRLPGLDPRRRPWGADLGFHQLSFGPRPPAYERLSCCARRMRTWGRHPSVLVRRGATRGLRALEPTR